MLVNMPNNAKRNNSADKSLMLILNYQNRSLPWYDDQHSMNLVYDQ